jgi:glucan phosphoethanolaminetransferase (alkaline phosphatase superfamily)
MPTMNALAARIRAARSQIALAASLFALLFLERLPAHDAPLASLADHWFWYMTGAATWTGVCMIPIWLFGERMRFLYRIVPPVWLLITTLVWFFRMNFETEIGGVWIGIVAGSSSEETIWFLKTYFGWAACIVFPLLAVMVVIQLRLASSVKSVGRLSVRIAATIVAAAAFVRHTYLWIDEGTILWESPVTSLVVDSVREWSHYKRLQLLRDECKTPGDAAPAQGIDPSCFGVFVLGESASRSHWSLYGYGRATTPRMDAIRGELAVFRDLVTPAMTTSKAMELMLTTATLEDKGDLRYTFPQALAAAGFEATLFSAQGRWGKFDGVESFAFAGCVQMTFLEEIGLERPWYDDSLLPRLETVADRRSKPTVAFLHLNGSHFPPGNKYPAKTAPFPHEEVRHCQETSISNYDNSIFFTDSLLGRIVDILKSRGGPTWMVYLSDHGESPDSKTWRTATDPDIWEVPMVIWLSDEYRLRFPETAAAVAAAVGKPLQSDQLLTGFIHLAGVRGCGVGTADDFLDASFVPRAVRMIEDGRRAYDALHQKQRMGRETGK